MEKLNPKRIENILALTPVQEGILFHYLKNPGSIYYFEQLSLEISEQKRVNLSERYSVQTLLVEIINNPDRKVGDLEGLIGSMPCCNSVEDSIKPGNLGECRGGARIED